MGFIRGLLLFLVGILLLLSFLTGNALLTLGLSLQYDHVQTELSSTVNEFLQGEAGIQDIGLIDGDVNLSAEVDDRMDTMREYCQNYTEYVFSYEDTTFVVPCGVVEEGPVAVLNAGIENAVERVYYKEYNCDFWDCIGEDPIPYFLVSAKARDYWMSKFYLTLVASLVLTILLFFLAENKKNFPVVLGTLIVIGALPFVKADVFIASLAGSLYLNFTTIFISQAPKVFWIMFIPGVIILAIGIILHFFHLGAKIAEKVNQMKEEKKPSVK